MAQRLGEGQSWVGTAVLLLLIGLGFFRFVLDPIGVLGLAQWVFSCLAFCQSRIGSRIGT